MDVVLNQAPQGKNQGEVIKALRRATFLDETTAKIVVNNLPWVIQKNLPLDEGVRIRAAIEAGGGRATLKPRITLSDSRSHIEMWQVTHQSPPRRTV